MFIYFTHTYTEEATKNDTFSTCKNKNNWLSISCHKTCDIYKLDKTEQIIINLLWQIIPTLRCLET